MCGICGEWNARGVDAEGLAAMNRLQAYRGPDDAGQLVRGEVGLAMSRLSIIDLDHGRQPISNEDGTIWIVFNGEIYNHRELRRELQSRGHRFRTASDTEVIVHLYEDAGEGVVEALRGMFAFAIWDAPRRRLFLARDAYGQKPLFYTLDGQRFLFASEIKAVLHARGGTPQLDERALDDYLTLRFVPSPSTMFRDVYKLPPGHWLGLQLPAGAPGRDAGPDEPRLEIRRYWDLRFVPKSTISETAAVSAVRDRVFDAVNSHLVSDVPVGAFLSGGMDSSLVVAMMAKALGQRFPTFAIGVAEQDFNELPYARQVAGHCGTQHHEQVVQADLVTLLPKMIFHLDEPSDPIAACMYHAAALASRSVKVVLTGDGGDEVFAGFDRYFGLRWARWYAVLPRWLRRGLLGPALRTLPDSSAYKNLTQKARWLHDLSFHRDGRRYAEATVFFRFGAGDKRGLYSPELIARLGGRDATDCIAEAFERAAADDDLDRMLYADSVTRLPEHSLMLTDRMTMAHGLEARSPFLDRPLAEFVAQLPAGLKMKGHRLKYLMRRVAGEWLPETILRRPKQGFMFPLGYWMKGPLVPVLRGLLDSSRLVAAGMFNREALARLLHEHLTNVYDHHVRLWMILNLEIWYRMYLLGESSSDVAALLHAERDSVRR